MGQALVGRNLGASLSYLLQQGSEVIVKRACQEIELRNTRYVCRRTGTTAVPTLRAPHGTKTSMYCLRWLRARVVRQVFVDRRIRSHKHRASIRLSDAYCTLSKTWDKYSSTNEYTLKNMDRF